MPTLAGELFRVASPRASAPLRPVGVPRPLGYVERRATPGSGPGASPNAAASAARDPLEQPFGFALAQGLVTPGQWRAAVDRAGMLGVGVDDCLVAMGLDEARLARGFAARWRLPYVAEPTLDAANGPGLFEAGVCALAGEAGGPRFAVAARGLRATALQRVISRPGATVAGGVAVVAPAALRQAAFRQLGPRLAREAARTCAPADSARRADPRPAQTLAAFAFLCLALLALVAGGLAGALATVLVGAFFLAAVAIRLAAIVASGRESADAAPLADADLPRYAVVAALHREESVVADLVAALDRLDYPREKLRVSLVVEEDDATTRAALAALALPPQMETIVVAPGRPRTKPRALNVALAGVDADLFVIYDAEDRPDPDQLRKAAARFAAAPSDLACLQARLHIDNAGETLLTRLFALDYAGLFEVINPGLAALGWPMLLGGTSNHFRVAALREVGGWDAWNVTEDADLGLRLARAGYAVGTLRSTTWEEAPTTFAAWAAQRRRWLKGWMQTAIVHSREPRLSWRQMGGARAFAAAMTLAGGLASALLGPFFALRVVVDAIRGDLVRLAAPLDFAVTGMALALIVTGLVCAAAPPLIAARRAGLVGLARAAPLLPLYYLLVSWAGWRALAELPRQPHLWAKTMHGVSRGRATRR
jgi:cellulose synthase/poly-beta-1,6-N-acetylglucosamine synthase-like glycosyltransferase